MSDADPGGETPPTDRDYAEWLDALADGEGFALACPDGHGSLPPRRVCPECGSPDLSREPLRETGTVETYSVVHVPSPRFADDAPYATAVVDFGPTRLTGIVRGDGSDEDAAPDVAIGDAVTAAVGERATDGERLVVFRPAAERSPDE
ncbi:nucleic acid-binding protein [Halorubrum sp. Atlit-8R]|uniref:Zn-ribbon domain-containing OB-fold protein n=1 Tax=unclassified Halorubrum TaxID=2642239 RepID=UPI000EF249DA|nr:MULTISPECIES: OB-fold domain-containing protein [unclassified Halorubrum]RLM70664.1 nucleic acid-binding protein [Halorubrum sp. Atlit-9R]RLM83180.1 nucleic acid-binding protein [Halorubrum sp. Atlit-8R]